MKIIVLIKQVPAPEAIISVKPDNHGLEIENKYVLNFFDELAVEEALRIREKYGSGSSQTEMHLHPVRKNTNRDKDISGSLDHNTELSNGAGTVTVISLGPHRVVESLRTGIAMGVDKAILINDPALNNADAYTVAKVLAQFIKKETPDIILCGKEAMDDNACQVGPAVAEFLGLPHISAITKLEIIDDKKRARVERQIESGKEIVECVLPAVFTTQKGINEPRVPLVTGVMKAMRAKIEEINLSTLGLSADGHPGTRTRILKYYEPPRRTKVKIIDGELPDKVKTLVRLLREEAKII